MLLFKYLHIFHNL